MLSVEKLHKEFNVQILGDKFISGCHDISFNIEAGQFFSLAGPSGIGKSTVLKCIYRTYLPGSGHIWYDSANYGTVDLATVSERILLDIRNREMARCLPSHFQRWGTATGQYCPGGQLETAPVIAR